ncbi:MAG TPA: TlpA disulfide reductase family protein [Steroidobacteraceae bacterium]
MRSIPSLVASLFCSLCLAQDVRLTEDAFRNTLGLRAGVQMAYRGLDCQALTFDAFVSAMRQPGLTSEVTRAADGSAVTLTVHHRGGPSCPSPYGPIDEMPAFDLADLAGRRVTSASLRGKPTLMNFYFSACKPCILEVGPLNTFAASRKDLNFLAITFDEPAEARAFVKRYQFQWRVLPDARDFIDRMAVNRYPMMALFDAQGRLLGMRSGGAKDALEAAAVGPSLRRWVDGLLRAQVASPPR